MLAKGDVIDGKYEIIKVLGKGGMSTVYLGKHIMLGIYRAIKEICREDCACYETLRQSLINEANILKELNHPNLPDIIDIRMEKDCLWIIMEYIPGNTLKEYIEKNGKVKEPIVIAWGRQLCDVLMYLHSRNPPIIYRDLKPSNVMRKPDGQIVLIDFGTAKAWKKDAAEDMLCLGTRGYAAPEQYDYNKKTDVRTDIYCLGATLYYLLTGMAPELHFCPKRGISDPDFIYAAQLEECIFTCLQIQPEKRYQCCEEVRDALVCLENNTGRHWREQKKILTRFFVFVAGIAFCGAGALFAHTMADHILDEKVNIYVKQAERTYDDDKKKDYYKKALAIEPHNKYIYESLLEQYVRTNDFQLQDAAELMSVLETSGEEEGQTVLEVLHQKDPAAYGMFCYAVGIGYFYYMETAEGKKSAQIWFEEAYHTLPESMNQGKKKRALLYAEISSYYNTFLTAGEDKSGEQTLDGYIDFFESLCRLNAVSIDEKGTSSQIAAVYRISVEVAAEIGNFAFHFQKDGKISNERIQKELDKIYREKENNTEKQAEETERINILEKFRTREEIRNLKDLVKDASRKNALAAMYLKQGGENMG